MSAREFHDGAKDGLVAVEPLDPAKISAFNDLLVAMGKTAFGGRTLGETFEVLWAMIQDPDCKVVMTLSGAMTIAKMGKIVSMMIVHGMVQCIVSTGALIAHGLSESVGKTHYQHHPSMSDEELFRKGYNRVYDTLEMEANLNYVEHVVSQTLKRIDHDRPLCSEILLLPLVYDELRKLAAARLADEKPGQTLQATALVHEAYLRLVDVERVQHWDSRAHFFAAAAEAMRRILVQSARRKARIKHGGNLQRCDVDLAEIVAPATPEEILAVDEALARLDSVHRPAAELVKLRYFAGMTIPEAADALAIAARKANQLWTYARAWLLAELQLTAPE